MAVRAADGNDAAQWPGGRAAHDGRCAQSRRRERAGAALSRRASCAASSIPSAATCLRRCCRRSRCIDGFADEWPMPSRPVPGFRRRLRSRAPNRRRRSCASACIGRSMHVYVGGAARATVIYEVPATDDEIAPPASSDRVIVLTRDEFGRERAWSISAVAPGPAHRAPRAKSARRGKPRAEDDAVRHRCVARDAHGLCDRAARAAAICSARSSPCMRSIGTTPPIADTHARLAAHRLRSIEATPRAVRAERCCASRSWTSTAGCSRAPARSASTRTPSYPGLRRDEDGFMRSIYRVLFSRQRRCRRSPYGLPYGMWGAPVDEARGGKAGGDLVRAGRRRAVAGARRGARYATAMQALGALVVEQPGEQLVAGARVGADAAAQPDVGRDAVRVVVTLVFAARLSHRIRRLSRAASDRAHAGRPHRAQHSRVRRRAMSSARSPAATTRCSAG